MNSQEYQAAASYWTSRDLKAMPREQVKAAVKEYLAKGGVCALATGAGDYVRCTPLEFSYHDGKFWIFTEGGQKFIGLEKNSNVSLAVFDNNPNFGNLKSVQVMGTVSIIEPMSPVYIAHAEYKNVPVPALQKLADQGRPMHLLCIVPAAMDVLFSQFKEQGYDSRQVLDCVGE